MTPKTTFFFNTKMSIFLTVAGFGFLFNGAVIVQELFHVGMSIVFSMGCYIIALYFVMREEDKRVEQIN